MPRHNEPSHPCYDLLRDRQALEERQPKLAGGYQEFLKDFAQFREMQKQFERRDKKAASPALAARPKS
ncbi:MAG TPA: hypothetical protein VGM86_26825 [Thermoanaerobaculia bacterium]